MSIILRDQEMWEDTLLFAEDFTPGWESRWEISGGEWHAENGVLDGIYRGNAGGLIYTRQQFPGDIVMDFIGRMVPPCNNDLNFSFCAKGWDYTKGDADTGYIAGLNGWWKKRAGIERYPGCRLFAMDGSFVAESDRDYHIQAGILGNLCFIIVDGTPLVLMGDPDPIRRADCARVGLGTYCSHVHFRNFKVFRAKGQAANLTYMPVF
jgi:hypothetical protein